MNWDPADYLNQDELETYQEYPPAMLNHLPPEEELQLALEVSRAEEEERFRQVEAMIENQAEDEVAETEEDMLEEGQNGLTPAEREELLENYREYWRKRYGITPLIGLAQIQRERRLRQEAGLPPPKAREELLTDQELIRLQSQIQAKEVAKLESKLQELPSPNPEELALRRVQTSVRRYLQTPCENRKELEGRYIHPAQVVKFHLRLPDNSTRIVCYDVLELYPYLVNRYPREQDWRESKYEVLLTRLQRELIKEKWRNRSGCRGEFTQLFVSFSEDERIRVPLSLYDRGTHAPNSLYVLYRIYLPDHKIYTYIHADGHTGEIEIEGERIPLENPNPHLIKLPSALIQSLGLQEGSPLLVEDCFQLPRITRLILQPMEAKWYQLPEEATEDIVNFLTSALENLYTIQLGQLIPIEYGEKIYKLAVIDLFGGTTKRRVPAAVTKQTTTDVEILPLSSLTRIILSPQTLDWYQAPEEYIKTMLKNLVTRLQRQDFVELNQVFNLVYGPKSYALKIIDLFANKRVFFGLITPTTSIEILQE